MGMPCPEMEMGMQQPMMGMSSPEMEMGMQQQQPMMSMEELPMQMKQPSEEMKYPPMEAGNVTSVKMKKVDISEIED